MMYKETLELIYLNGKLHHDCLKLDFYIKRDLVYVYDNILQLTNFLDNYNPSFRERIFYLESNLFSVQVCPHCSIRKLKFKGNTLQFTKHCGDSTCRSEQCKISNKGNRSVEKISMQCLGCNSIILHRPCELGKYCNRSCFVKFRKYTHTEETKKKIRETNKKTHNTAEFKLKKLEIYTEEYKKHQSEVMKQKILSGQFTPCITNSWTHWDAKVQLEDGTIRKFRSSWEACFWLCNQHLEYEKIRIPYEINNTWKNYIIDFVDAEDKILYEIKPESIRYNEINILKSNAAKNWCKMNDYTYIIISDNWFIENVKYIDFKNNKSILEKMRQFFD